MFDFSRCHAKGSKKERVGRLDELARASLNLLQRALVASTLNSACSSPPEFLHSAPSTELRLEILSETLTALLPVRGQPGYLFRTETSSALHSVLIQACQSAE